MPIIMTDGSSANHYLSCLKKWKLLLTQIMEIGKMAKIHINSGKIRVGLWMAQASRGWWKPGGRSFPNRISEKPPELE